jgi:hypothetical protein
VIFLIFYEVDIKDFYILENLFNGHRSFVIIG